MPTAHAEDAAILRAALTDLLIAARTVATCARDVGEPAEVERLDGLAAAITRRLAALPVGSNTPLDGTIYLN